VLSKMIKWWILIKVHDLYIMIYSDRLLKKEVWERWVQAIFLCRARLTTGWGAQIENFLHSLLKRSVGTLSTFLDTNKNVNTKNIMAKNLCGNAVPTRSHRNRTLTKPKLLGPTNFIGKVAGFSRLLGVSGLSHYLCQFLFHRLLYFLDDGC